MDNQGLGLIGLRDRVETLRGQLEFETAASGFSLTARFNLEQAWEVQRLDANDGEQGQYRGI